MKEFGSGKIKILAIEQSTPAGSVALIENSRVVAEQTWTDDRNRSSSLFRFVPEICRETNIEPGDVSIYAVDLGPGVYTGLRIALIAAESYALPSRTPLYGVSCGHVLARQVYEQHQLTAVTVIGDARCNHIWHGSFILKNGLPEQNGEWETTPRDNFPEVLDGVRAVVTSEGHRLSAELTALRAAGVAVVSETLIPSAGTLGILAELMMQAGTASHALRPIYAHPPVRR